MRNMYHVNRLHARLPESQGARLHCRARRASAGGALCAPSVGLRRAISDIPDVGLPLDCCATCPADSGWLTRPTSGMYHVRRPAESCAAMRKRLRIYPPVQRPAELHVRSSGSVGPLDQGSAGAGVCRRARTPEYITSSIWQNSGSTGYPVRRFEQTPEG
jgi:hypothetical protein